MPTKAELRARYIAIRRAIAPDDRVRWNAAICERLLALAELQTTEEAYIYVAAPDEVETRPIIEALIGQGRRVLAPIGREAGRMDWGLVHLYDELRAGRFGLLEPAAVTSRDSDPHRGIAIVPCVAFTAEGDRLGRGGGFYDHFLANFYGPAIGLGYELQRADALPVETHDVRVQRVVTESGAFPPFL